MAGTLIDVVMKDLSFLETAQTESSNQEQPSTWTTPHEQPQKPSVWHRLLGFFELVR